MADTTKPEEPIAGSASPTMPTSSTAVVEAAPSSPTIAETALPSSTAVVEAAPSPPTVVEASATVAETALPSSATVAESVPSSSKPTPTDPKAALAARMARFKSLQDAKEAGRKANEKEVRDAQDRESRMSKLATLRTANDKAAYKLLKSEDPDFERKRNWDYTVEESEKWDKRVSKKSRNRDSVAFSDFRGEANKVYKRQVGQMSKVDMDAYAKKKGETLQRQVRAGLLELVETEEGDVFTLDKSGRVNTPAEENYNCDHKPSEEAIDRLVADLDKGEKARMKMRAARGMDDADEMGDVTYINQKNKQFNDKLARFYNKYTSEIRESFERGTAI
ncbi:SYF2-domain-containing protein [Melanomma pulvis-pyrius CBS 109.77]|uniref:Pre-mRNA-splicing factor SYF2 n=1 Tax=Melanomma pulvis-pyrius CBS 109.77 TaxID=1314802 RepID=A0A6A6XZ97_9PLEO|nr:SYF2-domain-containing protein [Melanomma pulvis-pyrius CBS 109.77]